jgi:hypothetical protein
LVSTNTAVAANTDKVGLTTAQTTLLGNTSGANTGDQDISGIETNITTNATRIATNITAIALNTAKGAGGGITTRVIGENYGGGIVFYVYDGGQHGLIAAPEDQSTGIRCYGGTYLILESKQMVLVLV